MGLSPGAVFRLPKRKKPKDNRVDTLFSYLWHGGYAQVVNKNAMFKIRHPAVFISVIIILSIILLVALISLRSDDVNIYGFI